MQAVTIAIGKAGITHFAQQLIADELVSVLSTLKPPDQSFSVPKFSNVHYANAVITLAGTSLTGFKPVFQGVVQQAGGTFTVTLLAESFSANYNWSESYDFEYCYRDPDTGEWYCDPWTRVNNNDQQWSPAFGSLTVSVQLGFVYDQASSAYQLKVLSSSAAIGGETATIPGWSCLELGQAPCSADTAAMDAANKSIQNIDFGAPISTLFAGLVDSIPASGQLTPDITYSYALGDSGLGFPGDDGITVGATGTVTYKGQEYPGAKPPPLPVPLPPAPADPHHLRLYVSSYEMDALHWAYYRAGLLAVTVSPDDDPPPPDPGIFKVKTWSRKIKALGPYVTDEMSATVAPNTAPTIAFQDVWIFTKKVMGTLQGALPTDVYQAISASFGGNAYVAVSDLEADLTTAAVPTQYVKTIEDTAKSVGMAVTQDLQFTLTIQNRTATPPVIVFDLSRTDVLQDLELGVAKGGAQTLKYAFTPVNGLGDVTGGAKATLDTKKTTVPGFVAENDPTFGDDIWPNTGEPAYDTLLKDMGTGTGVPLPVMSGFRFLFEQAELSIQEGYVSILAELAYKLFSIPDAAAHQPDFANQNIAAVTADFQQYGKITLTAAASVSADSDHEDWDDWTVRDGASVYHVYRAGDELQVYAEPQAGVSQAGPSVIRRKEAPCRP